MRRLKVLFLSGLLVLCAWMMGCRKGQDATTAPAEASPIAWASSFDEGMKGAAAGGKPMMIDFTTDWCPWCKKLDQEVYSNAEVAELAKEFVSIKVDAEKDPKSAAKYKVEGFPTIVFTDPKGEEIRRVVGYRPAKDFLKEMKKAKEGPGENDE